jgi:hypothetical protein
MAVTYEYHPSTEDGGAIISILLVVKQKETHDTTFAIQIGVDFFLESRLVHISRAYTDTEGNSLFHCFSSNVLEDSDTGVDPAAFFEKCADGPAGAFGCDEYDINIFWRDDLGVFFIHDGEAVREIECLALRDERCNGGPCLRLSSIGEKVHDDSSPVDGLLDRKQSLSWHLDCTSQILFFGKKRLWSSKKCTYPAIFLGLPPALTILADTNNDIETIIAGIQSLAMALGSIANEG